MRRKSSLKHFLNPINRYSVTLTEKLTKRDQDLVNEAKSMGVKITTSICKPQVWKDCGNNKFLEHTLVDKNDLLDLAKAQKLRCVAKKPSLKPASECLLSTDFRKNTVTLPTESGKGLFNKDSPVNDTSLYEKLKAVHGYKRRMHDLVESLFNQENKKTRRINVIGSFEEQTE